MKRDRKIALRKSASKAESPERASSNESSPAWSDSEPEPVVVPGGEKDLATAEPLGLSSPPFITIIDDEGWEVDVPIAQESNGAGYSFGVPVSSATVAPSTYIDEDGWEVDVPDPARSDADIAFRAGRDDDLSLQPANTGSSLEEEGIPPEILPEDIRGWFWSEVEASAVGVPDPSQEIPVDERPRDIEDVTWDLGGSLPRDAGDSVIYPSAVGLTERGPSLYHLFDLPVEVLANYTSFSYSDGVIHPRGRPMLTKRHLYRHQIVGAMRLAQQADTTYAMFAALPANDARRRKYFENHEVLTFMRCVVDCVFLAWQEIRLRTGESPGGRVPRAIRRFKDYVVRKPYDAATVLKQTATQARGWYFGGRKPDTQFARTVPSTKRAALIYSYIARALPSPSSSQAAQGLKDLEERLCGGCKVAKTFPSEAYRAFVREYLHTFMPKRISLWSMPSASASLGYKRKDGGHLQAVQGLVFLGYCLNASVRPQPIFRKVRAIAREFSLTLLNFEEDPKESSLKVLPDFDSKQDLENLLVQSTNSEFWRQCLTLGTIFVMEALPAIPVLPIAAGEKGLKLRYPTLTHVAANLVYQVLRRALEQHMVLDQRCSEGLGGRLKSDLGTRGPWYSQDATFATDLHTFELTRAPYEELLLIWPELRKYERWFDKLFGPKSFITASRVSIPDGPKIPFMPALPAWASSKGNASREIIERGARGVSHSKTSLLPGKSRSRHQYGVAKLSSGAAADWSSAHKAMAAYVVAYEKWLTKLASLEHRMTTNGGMMGDATSFPIMSLQSLYAAKQARLPKKRGKYVGDDSVFGRATPEKVAAYEAAFLSLGGMLSKAKTFIHPRNALITEQPVVDGKLMPFTLLSMWTAPPGGSKGTITPYSQVATIVDHLSSIHSSKKRALWRKTPFRQWHRHLAASGLPVGAPVDVGGLAHPTFRPEAGAGTFHQKWLTHISQLSVAKLLTGTGLNVLMPTGTNLLRSVGRGALNDLMKIDRENKAMLAKAESIRSRYAIPDKTLGRANLAAIAPIFLHGDEDANYLKTIRPNKLVHGDQLVDHLLGPVQSWEFYFREPLPKDNPRPALTKVIRRFQDRINRTRLLQHKRFKTNPTLRDLDRKRNVFVVKTGLLRNPSVASRRYGLEPNLGPRSSRDAKDKIYLTPTGDLTGQHSRHRALLDGEMG